MQNQTDITLFKDQLLFEDNHLMVINKASSQIVHADKTGDLALDEIAKLYLKETYHKPGNVFCGVVHRLDRPVSGALILAKTSKALVRLNKQLQDKEIKKTYWALTKNKPPLPNGTLENYLIREEAKNKTYITRDQKKGKLALLHYTLLLSSENYHLLEIQLETGKHHQIRAQLAHIGCPIKGDLKYGAPRSNADGSICLHSRSLHFIHPVKQEPIDIVAAVPNDSLWLYFEKAIQELSTNRQ